MKIDKRFREAIEQGPQIIPDYGFIVFAVCAIDQGACGWSGWIFDGLFRLTPSERHPTGTGDQAVPADYTQRCPRCSRTLFRTGYIRRINVVTDPPFPGVESEPADDIQYE